MLFARQKVLLKVKKKINDLKTQAILFPFNKSPKRIPSRRLAMQGTVIPRLDSVKYLEITLDTNLTFKQHILQTCLKAIKCGRALFPLMNQRSTLNIKSKTLLHKMCIRQILTYGYQVWSTKCAK